MIAKSPSLRNRIQISEKETFMQEIIHIQTQSILKIQSYLNLQLDQRRVNTELQRFKNKIP
jgi:hypothetical protein